MGPSQVPFSSRIPRTIRGVFPSAEVLLGLFVLSGWGSGGDGKAAARLVRTLFSRVCRLEGFTARWDKFEEGL